MFQFGNIECYKNDIVHKPNLFTVNRVILLFSVFFDVTLCVKKTILFLYFHQLESIKRTRILGFRFKNRSN